MPAYRVGWIGKESCRYLMNNVVVEMKRLYNIDIAVGKSPSRKDPLFGPQDVHMVFFYPFGGERSDPKGDGLVYMDEARSMIKPENQLFVVTCHTVSHLDSPVYLKTQWKSSFGENAIVTLGDIVDPDFTSGIEEYDSSFQPAVENNRPEKCIPWICNALKIAIEQKPTVAVSRIQQRVDIYWPRYITEYPRMPIDLLPLLDETGWALQGLGIQCIRYDKDPPLEATSGIAVHCFRHRKGKGLKAEETSLPVLNIPTIMVPLVDRDFVPSPGSVDTDPPQDTDKYYWTPMAVREQDRLPQRKELLEYDAAAKKLVIIIALLVTKGPLPTLASSSAATVPARPSASQVFRPGERKEHHIRTTNKLTIIYNVTVVCKPEQFMSALATEVKRLKPEYTVELQPLKDPKDYIEKSGLKVFLYLFVSVERFDYRGVGSTLEDWLPGMY